jgi:DHA1 family bicyclomycin/chloramphenicol resistance-like MFS transporter
MVLSLGIVIGIHFLLPESKKPDPNFSMRPGPLISNFAGIIKQPQFYTYALTGAMSYAGLSAYISGSPHVFMEIFNVSEKQYGWIFAIIAMGLITASQINNVLLKNYTSVQIIRGALSCQIVIGLVMVISELLGLREVFFSIFFIFLFLSCQGFIFPNASALSLAEFGHNAGSASALMGAVQMCIGAGASALVSVIQNNTTLPMTGVMASAPIIAICIYSAGRNVIVKRASVTGIVEEDVEMISTL